MDLFLLIAGIIVAFAIIIGISYVKAPPDTAFIITGPRKQRVLIGQAGFKFPSLNALTKYL